MISGESKGVSPLIANFAFDTGTLALRTEQQRRRHKCRGLGSPEHLRAIAHQRNAARNQCDETNDIAAVTVSHHPVPITPPQPKRISGYKAG